jgi:hypothetical protein
MLICKTCGISFEPVRPTGRGGPPTAHCPGCRQSGAARTWTFHQYYITHKDKFKAASSLRRKNKPAEVAAAHAAWRKKHPDYAADRSRAKLYGLLPDKYRLMLASQDGRCAICHRPPSGKRGLHVDHDHTTGAVRALLCSACNSVVGFSETSGVPLREAEAYILLHTAPK